MERWRAQEGGIYWTVNISAMSYTVDSLVDNYFEDRDYDYHEGNYFATREESEKALEIIKSALVGSEVVETVEDILKRVDKMAEEFVGDWEDTDSRKWFIDYSSYEKTWDCNYSCENKGYGTKYITDDKEVVDKIIAELNKAQEREGK